MRYIRLIEILNTQELTIIKLAFNEADIEYKTLFENTLQIAEVYALGNRGVIIEVVEKDVEKAKKILSGLGIELDYDKEKDKFEFVDKLDALTGKIPLIGRLQFAYRFILLCCSLFALLATFILLDTIRISKNEIVGHYWCVEEIIHNGVILEPNTLTNITKIGYQEKCSEDILIHESRMIALPGFDTYDIRGNYHFKTEAIIVISGLEEFKEIYEGEYLIETNFSGTMEFVSDKTMIKISRKF